MDRLPQNAITLAAYLGGVATILVLQAIQPETQVVVMPGAANILARPPTTIEEQPTSQPTPSQPIVPQPVPQVVPTTTAATCRKDEDCVSPTAICAIKYAICEEMRSPTCSCSQPQVLLCTDAAKRSKHTFCANGCGPTEDGAGCL